MHAERAGISWAAFPDQDHYPTKFYTELAATTRAANIHPVRAGVIDPFVTMALAGTLPRLVYAWGPGGADEHPPFLKSDPGYITRGATAGDAAGRANAFSRQAQVPDLRTRARPAAPSAPARG